MTSFLSALVVTGLIVVLALNRGYLSGSGSAAALVVGSCIIGFGSWRWGVLLALFFFSSSLLSRFKDQEKRAAAEKFAKGHTRDWAQVVANGGLGALWALALLIWPPAEALWRLLYIGSLAAVNADTWATELGTLSRRPPRLITNGQAVEVGTSGAITPFGTFISAAGGGFIGLGAALVYADLPIWSGLGIGLAAGLAGSLFDSLLGATVQRLYYDEVRGRQTERATAADGRPNRPVRGWSWLNNDVVNLGAALVGALLAALLGRF